MFKHGNIYVNKPKKTQDFVYVSQNFFVIFTF